MRKILSSLVVAMSMAATASASAEGCNAETPIESRIEECTKVIEEASTDNTELAIALAVRGITYRDLGNLQEAIDDFDRAVDLLPQEPEIRYHRAVALSSARDFSSAISDLDWIIGQYPGAFGAYLSRCYAKMESGDQWGAIHDCESSLRIEPNLAAAYNNLALALYRAGAVPQALNDIDVALSGAPEYWGFLDTRAHILVALDRKEEAIAEFQRAAENGAAEAVALYQAALREKGYYDGPKDGRWSDSLQDAIKTCVLDGCGLLAEAGTLPVLEEADAQGGFDPIWGCFFGAGLGEDSVMLSGETAKTLITPEGATIIVIVDETGDSHIIARTAAGLFTPELTDAANEALEGCE